MTTPRQHIRITDVALRDGLQNEPAPVSTADKLRLAELLHATNCDEIELTSFVSPKWVPQLADAAELTQRTEHLAQPAPSRPTPPTFSVLVPNEKGLDAALTASQRRTDANLPPLKIALFTAASETFNKRNTNATIAESIERFRPILPRAAAAHLPIRIYISTAVACPFEGPITPDQVAATTRLLHDLVATELGPDAWPTIDLDLGDTIGVATPIDITALITTLTNAFSDSLLAHLTLHLHDTEGRAPEAARAALDLGVTSFDASAGGLGGCPYATHNDTRAPGNIATTTLIHTIESAGYTSSINKPALEKASAFAQSLINQPTTSH